MDEYIKREDALDAVLFALVGTGLQSTAIYALRDVPAADVAPKSEVAREIIKDLVDLVDRKERLQQRYYETFYYVNSDDLTDFIAELKKKYTEGNNG